jgi:hypothetical protein
MATTEINIRETSWFLGIPRITLREKLVYLVRPEVHGGEAVYVLFWVVTLCGRVGDTNVPT